MKIAITAAILSLALAFSASAAEYQTAAGKETAPRDLFACERGPVNRVALTAPAPCCAGQMVCSQFLSTSTMVHTQPDART